MDETVNGADPAAGEPPARPALDFPVVGVGASAGGVEAMRRFFSAVPADPDIAFIAVLHLSPEHKSNLASILGKATPLPVREVEDGMPIEPNTVYVIVPETALKLADGVFRVEAAGERPRHPIDTLFASMAEEQHHKAVAVVLSGAGTNGASGILTVKEKGGIVLVQDPETADFSGMPSAALSTGVVDLIRAPEAMPREIVEYFQNPTAQTLSAEITVGDD